MPHTVRLTRRAILAGTAAAITAPAMVRAQAQPIRIATLTPLTGAGGVYGPPMRDAVKGVFDAVNAAGGVLGRQIQLTSEDTQTNPDAAVRAARKLIDVDRSIAIIGTWASAVTQAVAPLCWENRVALCTVSGADSITQLPHQGFIFRTQPSATQQFNAVVRWMHRQGGAATRLAFMGPQTPFAQGWIDSMRAYAQQNNLGNAPSVIYEATKTSYRSEVDQIMREQPNFIFLGGYTPDTSVLLRDIFRADYRGKMLAPAYSVNQQLVDALPAEATEGVYNYEPWSAAESNAYARVKQIVNRPEVDPYTAQTYDHANLVTLAIQAAGEASGVHIRDNVRKISQGGGDRVDWAVDGLRLLREGKKIDYTGASGDCDFADNGDVVRGQFRFQQVRAKRLNVLGIES
jgi:branched-chain amino acid transport system substrate-binding protein